MIIAALSAANLPGKWQENGEFWRRQRLEAGAPDGVTEILIRS
jgi:hypothetical protein